MGDGLTFISGTGRSGTSFVAACFRAAGVGTGGTFSAKWRAGYEHAPVVQLNKRIRALSIYPECDDGEALAGRLGSKMRAALDGLGVTKDPRFCMTLDAWVHAGLVGRVVACVRRPSEVERSVEAAGMTREPESPLARIGYLTWVCDHHRIERSVVRFPHVVREEGPDFWALVTELEIAGALPALARDVVRGLRRTAWVTQS